MDAGRRVIAAQTVLRGRRARYSHVAMAIDDEVYVHSTPEGGICIGSWAKVEATRRIKALRHLPSEQRSTDRLAAMLVHYGKAYNRWMALKGSAVAPSRYDDAFYCSEFVCQVFSRAELAIKPGRLMVLPVDLEALAGHPDWADVTNVYLPLLGPRAQGSEPLMTSGMGDLFRSHGEFTAATRDYAAKNEALGLLVSELKETIGSATAGFAARK